MDFRNGNQLRPNRTRSSIIWLGFSYLSVILAVVQGIILVPLYLQKFNVVLYGAWLASGNVISYLALFDFGLAAVVQQQVGKSYGAQQFDRVGYLLGTGIIIMAGFSLAVILIGVGLTPFIPAWIGVNGTDAIILRQAIYLAIISTALTIWTYSFLTGIIALQRMMPAGLVSTVSGLMGVLATFSFLVYTNAGLLAIPLGSLVRAAVFFFSSAFIFTRLLVELKIAPRFNSQESSLLFGLISVVGISTMAKRVSLQMDSLIAALTLGSEQAAVLGLSGRALEAMRPIPDRISSSLLPGLSHLFGESNLARVREVFLDVMNLTMSLSVFCAAAFMALNKSFVGLWVGEKLFVGQKTILVIALTFLAIMFRSAAVDLLFSIGEIKLTSWLGISETVFRLLFSVLFAYWFGIIGIPLGAFIAVIINNVPIIWLFFQRAGLKKKQLMDEVKIFIVQTVFSFAIAGIWAGLVDANSPVGFVFSTISVTLILVGILFAINPRVRVYFMKILKNLFGRFSRV